ncbi:MAG TPA: hypothetical protein VLA00_14520, partial [Xanthobacteraceae bacterium]|nr:hypothetical protein [Xanthobacteraceae bacterium]
MPGAYIFVSPFATGDTSLPVPKRDALLNGDNNGVRFLFDLGFGYCYPGGPLVGRGAPGNPGNGATIYDVAERGNGVVRITDTAALTYAGGGIDLSAINTNAEQDTGVAGPASALADIWTAVGGKSQIFLICGYFKLPSTADWNVSGALSSIFSACASGGGYASAADILNVAMSNGSPYRVGSRRQTAVGSHEGERLIQPVAGDYGSVVQIAYWRNDAGTGLTLRSANGRVTTTAVKGADNSANFSALTPLWGAAKPFTSPGSDPSMF